MSTKSITLDNPNLKKERFLRVFQINKEEDQQILHAIIPDEKMSETQTGFGSTTDLYIHTEDTFLKHQAEFLTFLYVRNDEKVPSTLYSIRSHEADSRPLFGSLFEPIKVPKDANLQTTGEEEAVFDSILYGNPKLPFIRFDATEQLFNPKIKQVAKAQSYLMNFWQEAKSWFYSEFILKVGDLALVNNHLCVHGRSAFRAGVTLVEGQEQPCQRRIMLRMMSKVSLIEMCAHTLTEVPYFVIEEHLGKNYRHLQ